MRYRLFQWVLGATLSLAIQSCASSAGRFDLVPSVPPGAPNNQTGYCIDNQRIGVVVKNFGTTNVQNVDVKVTFSFQGTTSSQPPQGTGPIAGGGSSATLEFPIPQGCFDADCNFTITVDPENKFPDEGNEGNNTVSGDCIG